MVIQQRFAQGFLQFRQNLQLVMKQGQFNQSYVWKYDPDLSFYVTQYC